MSNKSSLAIARSCGASLVLAALALSLAVPTASAANTDHGRAVKPLPHRHHLYATHGTPSAAPPRATLPYRPEYGFLRQVPANAIRGPGYTFVPNVGILGKSCDLPTSACTNEYRDVQ